ncbi:MAG: biotin--[acetyl-CoA-carboxylase] ligase [Deltaproteobacteria bacterium]|nr:biotin--[acetyl-CoA-carboxylase] ligase [Deltaproteobacteria bacterium]
MTGGPARILDALRRAGGETRSGEALSSQLGVSRTQVWKHVEALRARGYTIDGDPGGGYRLSKIPDRLYVEEIQTGLDTSWLATEIHYFESVDSTNRVALDLARSGSAHGTTVVADQQTAGRGRLGRSFFSPPATNLYTSIILRPRIHTAEAPSWILAAAVSVAETIEQTLGRAGDVAIKWPNDVLLGGLKTSGILMELGAEATRVDFLVLGIGVNLNVDRNQFPDEFRDRATSLASHSGHPVDRLAFARRLYGNLEVTLDICADRGFDGVRGAFDARFRMRNQSVSVLELDGSEIRGTALGIDDDGALRLRLDTGDVIRVIAGDVTLTKESR